MTLSIALRNMKTGKAGLAFSVAGVAVATLLLSFILALYRGWNDGLVTYIEDTDADVWVAPYGSESFFTPGLFSKSFLGQVAEQPGVSATAPLIYRPSKLRTAKGAWDAWIVGFVDGSAGGPTHLKSGVGTPKRGEIVVDDVLAKLADLSLGSTVDVGGTPLKVVGISTGGNVVFAQLAFVSAAEAEAQAKKAIEDAGLTDIPESLKPGNSVNLGLVSTQPGQAKAVSESIRRNVIGVRPFLSEDFSSSSRAALKQSMLPILLIILVLAFLVGTLVLGLTVYTSVLEKEREFGVIKAIGTPGLGLLRVVLEQALFCCVAGFVAGILLSFLAAVIVKQAVPQFIVLFRPGDIALVFVGTVLMSVLASVIPAGRIMRVDTLSVFKA